MADYSKLPDAILKKIVTDHLETHSHHIAFSQVCQSWRTTATALLRRRRRGRPGLLISHKSKPPLRTPLEFFPIGDSTLPLIPTRPPLWPPPPPQPPATKAARKILNRRLHEQSSSIASFNDKLARNQCVGSKDGWLLLLYPGNRRRRNNTYLFNFYLYNPTTAAHVSLLDLTLEGEHDGKEPPIIRTVISSSPDHDDEKEHCHVFIVFKHTLAWSTVGPEVGGQIWKLTSLHELNSNHGVLDASYFGGKLFLVSDVNRLIAVDIPIYENDNIRHTNNESDTNSSRKQIVLRPTSRVLYLSETMISNNDDSRVKSMFTHLCHLGQDEDDQLPRIIISRFSRDDGVTFQLYKLVRMPDPKVHECECGWEEVTTSLNGYSVFLGSHQTFAIRVNEADDDDDVSVKYGVGANRIYFSFSFTEHHLYMDHHMFWCCHQNNCGVFDFEDGEVEWFNPIRPRHLGDHSYVWFLPVPWEILGYMHGRKGKKLTGPSA